MSKPSEVQGAGYNLTSPVQVRSSDPQKELLTTLLAIAAIGAVLLSIHALSYAGLSGLNSLSGATVASIASLLIALSAYCFYSVDSDADPLPESLNEEAAATCFYSVDSDADPLPESLNEEAAATTIQRAWRKHTARLAEKLKSEREEAAISIQGAFPTQIEQKKLETELKAQESIPEFSAHKVTVFFPSDPNDCKLVFLRKKEEVETMVKQINDEINQYHTLIKVGFEHWWLLDECKERMECYQRAPSAANLQFNFVDTFLCIKPKSIEFKELGGGKTRRTFANGVVETFILKDDVYKGDRVFPNGKKEVGKFDVDGKLNSGYRVGVDKQIEFHNPESFLSYSVGKSTLKICEVEGKLVVLEDSNKISTVPVSEVLIKASARSIVQRSIKRILLHKDFEQHLHPFIEFALGTEESGMPRLFGFSDAVIIDVLEVGFKDIDPLEIIDPASNRNIFLQAVFWKSKQLLNKLAELFPRAFDVVGQGIVAELLLRGDSIIDGDKLMHRANQKCLGGRAWEKASNYYDFIEKAKLDSFHSIWLQVAKGEDLDENSKKTLALLPPEQKKVIYDAAFTYDNPYVYEPADSPVRADQYSINLLWINKKIPADQESLFGNVAKWAKANPGSPINIWYDGEMTPGEAIDTAKQVLSDHEFVNFKNVRSIDIVRNNATVFSSSVPFRFRKDLLRAITADYVLQSRKTKYLVCGNIEMESLTGEQLFDKKTVGFLDDLGIVMEKENRLDFKSKFQILNGDNDKCMASHRKVVIDFSIKIALEDPSRIKEYQIHETYPAMFTHLLEADGRYGKLNIDEKQQKRFGSEIFRYDRFSNIVGYGCLPFGDGEIELSDAVPTKPVRS